MLISEIIALEADCNVDLCRSTLATTLHEAEKGSDILNVQQTATHKTQLAHSSHADLGLK